MLPPDGRSCKVLFQPSPGSWQQQQDISPAEASQGFKQSIALQTCTWSSDGLSLAITQANGHVLVYDRYTLPSMMKDISKWNCRP